MADQVPKITAAIKIKAVEEYLEGSNSLRQLGKRYGVHHSSIEKWVNMYRTLGREGLQRPPQNSRYTTEVKKEAVALYHAGEHSLMEICAKFKVRSVFSLQMWIANHQKEVGEES